MSGLIDYPAQIWLALAPVDMRRGLDGLSAIVQQSLGHAPCAGAAFIFRNRAGNRLRLLLWDGNGAWLCQRRLHQGSFVWPQAGEVVFAMTSSQALHDWLQQTRLRTAPNTATAKAIDYSLKGWVALTRYAVTGDLPIGRVEMQRGGLSF